jgi:hypothetical protein
MPAPDQDWIITKENGKQEPFSVAKFRNSLSRSGLSQERIDILQEYVQAHLQPGMSTRDIYRLAHGRLESEKPGTAARYHLKKALLELGPTGFPFEQFVARIFRHDGFRTEVGVVLQGQCVDHELDVVAEKGTEKVLVECKFRKQADVLVDVKVPLYIHSRFQDVLDNGFLDKPGQTCTGWIATNTRFSDDATAFANCKGIRLLSWDQPLGKGLKDRIDGDKLYPVTCLETIRMAEKKLLLEKEFVLVSDLEATSDWVRVLGCGPERHRLIREELEALLGA